MFNGQNNINNNEGGLEVANGNSAIVNGMDIGKRKSSKVVYSVLAGLGVVVVLLVVAIVVVNLNRDSGESEEEGEEVVLTGDECLGLDDSVAIGQCLQNVYYNDTNIDELISNYEKAIRSLEKKKDFESAVGMISDRSIFLVSVGRCDEAVKVLDSVGSCEYDNELLFTVYNDAVGVGRSCGDRETINKYTGLMNQLEFEGE